MINYLIRGNHCWEDIIDKYPVTLVKNLFAAGREYDRIEHFQLVTGLSIAVTNAIDMSFNKGKGKVLSTYIKTIEKSSEKETEPVYDTGVKTPKVSNSVMALFNALPKKETTDEPG